MIVSSNSSRTMANYRYHRVESCFWVLELYAWLAVELVPVVWLALVVVFGKEEVRVLGHHCRMTLPLA